MTDHARAIEAAANLLPCPFCGGSDLVLDENGYNTKWVICDGCGATIDDSPHGDCVDLWNRRAAIASGALVPASAGQRTPLDWGKLVQCILRCMDASIKNESSREQAERIATAIEERFDTAPASGDYVVVPRSDLQVVVEIAGRSEAAPEIGRVRAMLNAASRTGGGK